MLRFLTDALVVLFFLGMAGSLILVCITTVEDLAAFRREKPKTTPENKLLHPETRL
jgi:hypothetical protein